MHVHRLKRITFAYERSWKDFGEFHLTPGITISKEEIMISFLLWKVSVFIN